VVHLEVPPLRARGPDVLLLAQDFLRRLAEREGRKVPRLSPEAAQAFLAYEWPGNVRELLNALERALALSHGEVVRAEDLPDRIRQGAPVVVPDASEPATLLPLAEMEKRYILRVLATLQGNKRRTAEVLGLDRSTLYRKLQQYGQGVAASEASAEPHSKG
jgi:two-component system response regulator HydG